MRYSVFAGGKRLRRPVLALAAADAVSTQPLKGCATCADVAQGFGHAFDLAIPVACAVELIHAYSSRSTTTCPPWTTTRCGADGPRCTASRARIAILAGDGLHAGRRARCSRSRPRIPRSPIVSCACCASSPTRPARSAWSAGHGDRSAGRGSGAWTRGDARRRQPPRHARAQDRRCSIRASALGGAIMAGAAGETFAALDSLRRRRHRPRVSDRGRHPRRRRAIPPRFGKTAGRDAAGFEDRRIPRSSASTDQKALAAGEMPRRAHQAVADARLTAGWLGAIADWVVARRELIATPIHQWIIKDTKKSQLAVTVLWLIDVASNKTRLDGRARLAPSRERAR